MSKNAFYRLRNRLLDEVQQSMLVQYGRMDDDLLVHRTIMLARIAFNKDDYSTAHSLLLEAEKKALKIESYELAMLIYKELVDISSVFGTVNSHYYIEKRREIRLKHEELSELRYLRSTVTFKLTFSIHSSKTDSDIFEALKEIKNKLPIYCMKKKNMNSCSNILLKVTKSL